MTKRCNSQAPWIILAVVVACATPNAEAGQDSALADSIARARQDSINRAQPGYVVDSIFPIEEEIRRFNAGLETATALSGNARDRFQLVRAFVAALERSDTSALRELLVSQAEFGYLVFPESPNTRPPYKTKPIVIWTQLVSESQRGLSRLLERIPGQNAHVSDLKCDAPPVLQGRNRYWRGCTMLVRAPSKEPRRLRVFGPIIERGGRAKFLSYNTAF